MEHLDNIALIILLRLLFNTQPLELVIKDRSIESKNELLNYVNAINSYINTQNNCLNINSQNYTINLSVADRNVLNDYLINYAHDFNRGTFTNIDSMETLKNEFIKTRNERKTESNYPVHNIQFLPYVIYEYCNNRTFIRSVSIDIKDTEQADYPIKIYDYFESGEPSGKFYDNYERYFNWEICVNLGNYIVEKTKEKHSKTGKSTKNKKFSKTEQKLFKFLLDTAEMGSFVISKSELLSYCPKSSFDVIKSRLNAKFKQIYKKDMPLLTYNRTDAQYIISRDILS